MKVKELIEEVSAEMAEEKKDLAKSVLKSRIAEISKTERMLAKLKGEYTALLDKSVDEVADEIENRNVRF
jgi:hypothetical protein